MHYYKNIKVLIIKYNIMMHVHVSQIYVYHYNNDTSITRSVWPQYYVSTSYLFNNRLYNILFITLKNLQTKKEIIIGTIIVHICI